MKRKKKFFSRLRCLVYKDIGLRLLEDVLILSVVLIVFMQPFFLPYRYVVSVKQISEIEENLALNHNNIRMKFLNLKYTGYNYLENGSIKGAFYYSFMDGECVIVRLATTDPKDILENKTVLCNIEQDGMDLEYEILKEKMAADLSMTAEEFSTICLPYMLDAYEFPWLGVIVSYFGLYVVCGWYGLRILVEMIWLFCPMYAPGMKSLRDVGEVRLVYAELESQMEQRIIYQGRDYYFTEDYLVIDVPKGLEVIRISNVHYMQCKKVFNKKKTRYVLCLMNPESMFVECNFNNEYVVEEIMDYLLVCNSKIEDCSEDTTYVYDDM